MIKVDRGIEIPNISRKGRIPMESLDLPWADMEVGDSFFIPATNKDPLRLMNKITGSGNGFFGAGCVKARSVVEDNIFGIRAWRVQ